MVEFARRVSREEIAPLAQAVRAMMDQLEGLRGVVPTVQTVAAAQAKTAQERFYDALAARVSDWRAVNSNPKFHDWLLDTDPLSGLQRQTLLENAHGALDIDRVVSIFEAGKRSLGLAAPAPVVSDSTPARKNNADKLERMVAPGRASAATTPPQQAEKRQWTRQGIAKFYADKSRGVYKGCEAEAQALERDIFAAQREGRVALAAA